MNRRVSILIVTLLSLVHFGTLSMQFTRYPVLPRTLSGDYVSHLTQAQAYLDGSESVAQAVYPPVVHLLIGFGIMVLGGEPFISMQQTMVMVASLAPLLVYAVADKILRSQAYGLTAALTYMFTGPVWYFGLFSAGLYANFLGNLVSLLLLYLVVSFVSERRWFLYASIPLTALAGYMTHYTTALFIFSYILYMVYLWWSGKARLKPYAMALFLMVLPALPIIVTRFELFSQFLSFPASRAGIFNFDPDPIRLVLYNVSPFLLYLSVLLSSVFISLILSLAGLVYLGGMLKRRAAKISNSTLKARGWMMFMVIWFLSIWAVSPYNGMAWRFAYYALLPLTFILAYIAYNNTTEIRISRFIPEVQRWRKPIIAVTLVLVGVLYAFDSPFHFMVNDVYVDPDSKTEYDTQLDVYEAQLWVKGNTNSSTKFLSVSGDDRLTFINLVTGRPAPLTSVNLSPALASGMGKTHGIGYVVAQGNIVKAYRISDRFSEVYKNSSVSIFKLK